nr:Vnx1 [Starmerella bombicola]
MSDSAIRFVDRAAVDDSPSDDTNVYDSPESNDATVANTPQDSASIRSDESYTMRDRQDAINSAHPFGIRIWKPALYKKRRSVEQNAEEDIHSRPDRYVPNVVWLGNLIWTATLGLVLSLVFFAVWIPLYIMSFFSEYAVRYAKLLWEVSWFFLFPFGKYVQLIYNDNYRDEDDGHGRPVADYLAWQQNSNEAEQPNRLFFAPRRRRPSQYARPDDLTLGRSSTFSSVKQTRLFGRGSWSFARVVFFVGFYFVLLPVSAIVCTLCWLGVFGVPMARVIFHMLYHMRIHPLALSIGDSERDVEVCDTERVSIVLCTYRAFGLKYYKYTIDGTNVFLINMMFVVFLTILDKWALHLLSDGMHFLLSLVSIIPLAHFIGQAVASISAQSSMSMGATINAFFSTIVEVYLYWVALGQGKGELVEGSITGSVLAGVLLMPGLSMCAGALNCKTQRFNPKSAGATSTMLLYTVVGVIAPTIFYSFYGPEEVRCRTDIATGSKMCWTTTLPLKADDPAYLHIIKPFGFMCAIVLFIAYAIGLMFTLRTHASHIWTVNANEEVQEVSEDGPNWGRRKSYIILFSATILYAMIAEILVDSVDIVLTHVNISQRMLGITVFALVPNTTEFLNAISFALYGNVSLSLEIGSAYALQVCLLQIPALVLASQRHVSTHGGEALRKYVFVLLFPKWDTWAWILSMLLFCHVHSEGRSNYFKGSILILAYLVLVAGFHFSDIIRDLLPEASSMHSIVQQN